MYGFAVTKQDTTQVEATAILPNLHLFLRHWNNFSTNSEYFTARSFETYESREKKFFLTILA